jgi:hypothetical protein
MSLRLNRLEKRRARLAAGMVDDRRKHETRKKITLGGIVVKAGLRDAPPALLLGALLELAKLDPTGPQYQRLLSDGRAAFAADAAVTDADPS